MRHRVAWFILGVLVGSLFLVSAHSSDAKSPCSDSILGSRSSMGFTIQGPLNWSPRPVLTEIPNKVILQIQKLNPEIIHNTVHISTIVSRQEDDVLYSLFVSKNNGNRVWYVEWNRNSSRILRIGVIQFKLVENTTHRETKYLGQVLGNKMKVVKTFHEEKLRAVSPESLGSIYIVTAWESFEWYLQNPITGKESLTAKTVAKGRFYIDYGNRILGINDMSYDWRDTGVTQCSFNHNTEGVGTISGTVYVDAKYLIPTIPLGIHFDSHPRVYVDAWTHVSGNAWGNKSVGRPWC